MKRLLPVVLILLFLVQLADSRISRACTTPQLSSCSREDPALAACLPAESFSDQSDEAELLAPGLAGDMVLLPESFRENLTPSPKVTPSALKHFTWLGLGSGALPS